MFCAKCGNEVNGEAKFCPNCGAPKETQEVYGQSDYTSTQQPYKSEVSFNGQSQQEGQSQYGGQGQYSGQYQQYNQGTGYNGMASQKSRLAAGLLQIFLGCFGIGRFYLGYTGIGIAQLLVSVFTCGIGTIWPFVDGILILCGQVTTDANGAPLRD
jgi:TM2 domain-containing membrane protein YozV